MGIYNLNPYLKALYESFVFYSCLHIFANKCFYMFKLSKLVNGHKSNSKISNLETISLTTSSN